MNTQLIDELIDVLEAEKAQGVRYVEISDDNLALLDAPSPEPRPTPPAANRLAVADPGTCYPVPPSPMIPEVVAPSAPVPSRPPAAQQPPPPDPSPSRPSILPPRPDLDVDLATLEKIVSECVQCGLCQERTQTVFGVGDPEADLMFIGEGPGYEEDRQGEPFVGPAGQLLTKIIEAGMGLKRSDVYIANIVKCRPPNNRNPEDDEAVTCLPYLERQIELIQPKVIVVLGAVPLKALLNRRGITRSRGNWLSHKDIPVMPTFHPSYLLRVPKAKRDVWNDMQAVMQRLGLQRP
jgi:DNA polymerase